VATDSTSTIEQTRPPVDTLRSVRAQLAQAIAAGDTHLTELRDIVEDELVAALNRRRRERAS
jgi:hypothetical protein